jgi:hypothetical protein
MGKASDNQFEFYKRNLIQNNKIVIKKAEILKPYHKSNIYTEFTDEEEYHSFFGISQSALGKALRSPYSYYYSKYVQEKNKSSYHMDLGSYLHAIILEPHRLDEFYHDEDVIAEIIAERPDVSSPRSTKEYKSWLKQKKEGPGKLIKKEEIDNMRLMVNNVYEHKEAAALLSAGIKEKAILTYCDHWDLYLRGKMDCFSVQDCWILDLKKVQSINTDKFSRDIYEKLYFLQASFYAKLFELKFGKPLKNYYWLVSESNPPFEAELFIADTNVIKSGNFLMHYLATEIADCYAKLQFKKPKTAKIIDLPFWSDQKLDKIISEKYHERNN